MSKAKPAHAPMTQFPVVDDCLQVGGVPLVELARRVGRTPFYAYDRGLLTRRVQELRKHMPAVVNHLASLLDGLDVASAGELEVALASGMSPAEISFAGPGKTDAELAAACAAGIVVNLESEREMERLARLAPATGKRARVAVRVNPDFELKSSGMRMGGG